MLCPPDLFDSANLPSTLCIYKPSTEEILQLSHTHNLGYLHSWANHSQVHQRGEFSNMNESTATSTPPKKTHLASKAKSLSPFPDGKVKRMCHSIWAGAGHNAEGNALLHLAYNTAFLWRFYSAPNKDLPINMISVYKRSSEYILVPHVPQATLLCTSKSVTTLTLRYAYTR